MLPFAATSATTSRRLTSAAAARRGVRTQLQGTQVHPADLDDALLCLSVLTSGGDGSSETRLPFAVDGALLRGAAGKLVGGALLAYSSMVHSSHGRNPAAVD